MSLNLRGPRLPLVPSLMVMTDPISAYLKWVKRYGDPFVAQLPAGRMLVTARPEGIKEFFTADSSYFEPNAVSQMAPLVGLLSVIVLAGQSHQRQRKLLLPPFHGERMRSYGTLMQQIMVRAMEKVRPGDTVQALHLMQDISLEIIIRAVFGVEEAETVQRFVRKIASLSAAYTPLIAMLEVTRRSLWGHGPWSRYQKVTDEFNVMLQEQIRRRRESTTQGEDILSLLLSARDDRGEPMTDVELQDEMRGLLVAGHETSAVTMAWLMYFIHRHPEVRERVEQELAPLGPHPEPEALAKLPYLSAVIDETLRLCPAFPIIPRRLLKPLTILGHEVPAGMGVGALVTTAHRNPDLYPEPERFRPERFLERKYTPFEYLPFGGGYRRCIGMALAHYEIKVVIGTMLAAHRFSPMSDEEVRVIRRNFSLGPSTTIPMRYEGLAKRAAVAA